MKKLFALLFLLSTFISYSQFDTSSGTLTNEKITIVDTSYDVYKTANGSNYIICKSPITNNNYPVWIGTLTDKIYNNQPVRISKSGKYFILVKSKKSNNPYCKYLKQEEII